MTPPTIPATAENHDLHDLLRDMTSVCMARLSADGRLLDCNRGFARLAADAGEPVPGADLRGFFIRPDFAEFAAIPGGDPWQALFTGIFNVGGSARAAWSLHGVIYRLPEGLLFLAEHDMAPLEQLNATVLSLNEELAQTQRDLMRTNRELARKEEENRRLMLTDALTGLPNRRHFDQDAAAEHQRMQRHGRPVSIAMADIDRFKSVNDTHGHAVGDEVLKFFAQLLRANLRQTDIVARYGGEEFVMILPETGVGDALQALNKLHAALNATICPPLGRPLTASFGLADVGRYADIGHALAAADAALYQSKEAGRNRITLHSASCDATTEEESA